MNATTWWRSWPSARDMTLIGLIIALLLTSCDAAKDEDRPVGAVPNMGTPRIALTPSDLDLGEMVMVGGKAPSLQGVLTISNRGNAPLELLSVDTSCGCTVLEAPPAVVPPGGSVELSASVRPKMNAGRQSSTITIRSNDATTPESSIRLIWIETLPFQLEPEALDFGRVDAGNPVSRRVAFSGSAQLLEKGLSLAPQDSRLTTHWPQGIPDAGSPPAAWSFEVALHPSEDLGEFRSSIQVGDAGGSLLASLPVTWKVGPDLEVQPQALYHAGLGPGTAVMNRLILRGPKPIVVTQVEVDGESTPFETAAGDDEETPTSIVTFTVTSAPKPVIQKRLVRIRFTGIDGREDEMAVPLVLVTK